MGPPATCFVVSRTASECSQKEVPTNCNLNSFGRRECHTRKSNIAAHSCVGKFLFPCAKLCIPGRSFPSPSRPLSSALRSWWIGGHLPYRQKRSGNIDKRALHCCRKDKSHTKEKSIVFSTHAVPCTGNL